MKGAYLDGSLYSDPEHVEGWRREREREVEKINQLRDEI